MMDKISVWVGCTTRIHLSSTVKSLEKILKYLNVPYEILDTEDICCGSALFNTGQKARALEVAGSVVDLFNIKNVKN